MQTEISYTLILHHIRKKLELSLNEYCIAEAIYHLSTNPKSKISGWCYASKETLAEIIGISETSIYNILNKLFKLGLVEKKTEQKSFLRTTKRWYDYVIKNKTLKKFESFSKDPQKTLDKTLKKIEGNPQKTLDYINNKHKDKNKKDLPEKNSDVLEKETEEVRGAKLAKEQNFFEQGISSEQMVASHFPQSVARFEKKTPSQYNCNDLLVLFCIEYYRKYKIMYSAIGNGGTIFGGKDSRNLKALLRSQSPETLTKVIPYFINNYEKIPGVPKDKPSVSILYGWRNSVIPRCLLGEPDSDSIERGRRGEVTDEEWEREKEER